MKKTIKPAWWSRCATLASPLFQLQASSSSSNPPLLLFVCNSIVIQMIVGQDDVIARFSGIYWALVLPALIIPLSSLRQIAEFLLGRGMALLVFLVCAGSFHAARSEFQTVAQLCLLIWVIAWCACADVRLSTDDIATIFIASIFLGALISLSTDLNPWGLFPGHTRVDYGAWRVSFFPHIANSAVFSLILLMFLTRSVNELRAYRATLVLCIYFILFSFVRTVLVASVLYLAVYVIYRLTRIKRPSVLFVLTVLITAASIGCEWFILPVLDTLQGNPLVSRLLLRGQEGLSTFAIYEQLYRPWLWKEHTSIFISSPYLMGLGNFNLLDHVSSNLLPGLGASGSESFPTRLLASYGLPALLLVVYLLGQLARAARSGNIWTCACFPAIIFTMMNWGSVFHPTNVFFVLFFLLIKGNGALVNEPGPAGCPQLPPAKNDLEV
ncbi:hypothetical protein AB8Z38_00305 [Bradyrhizobium sp. LLZ17]|uniref:Uncharacterized protein n=1 Tax=Bradyrhizobium sp. LLZ17 TaxID=3239388 RepID=A0AB39XP04_9BRAD